MIYQSELREVVNTVNGKTRYYVRNVGLVLTRVLCAGVVFV